MNHVCRFQVVECISLSRHPAMTETYRQMHGKKSTSRAQGKTSVELLICRLFPVKKPDS